jgi:hypothetical protein
MIWVGSDETGLLKTSGTDTSTKKLDTEYVNRNGTQKMGI